ncbi:hypothetical protein G7K_5434-t1 [Saitoella complicata NRRL Y-17804]|uniref:Small ribosomal subunit protein uS17 N-terminal domain-containing protein n=1 Tax=Saitoella complicata (strain BCRC 22490 / CBS 7301 / JCM 7358 / NBRC 10748 / NRRL Y-17804) TaxID=698492 RepID=A0A0E9NN73_SAICN|nr:hypothetical protein G7K_5434-t1 [Saitoella complicata NRRL Y-17804]
MTDPTRNTGLIGVYARRGEWDERYMQQEKKSKVTAAEKGLYKGQRFSDCQVLEPDVPGKVYGPAHREILETPYPDDNSRSTVMATELTVQHERAFLKQPHIFLNSKSATKKSIRDRRWYKDVGLGFKTPKEAIQGNYIG